MTRQQLIENWDVIEAFKNGAEIECKYTHCKDEWEITNSPLFNFYTYDYRIKPAPCLRPWKTEEVPVGAWIRRKKQEQDSKLSLILARGEEGLTTISCDSLITLTCSDIFETCEHSTNGGKTWKPCGVEL